MSRKKEHEAEKENGERWLLTYADLITLLMIFFVVLYSMSKVDAQRFAAVAESLSKALGGGTPAKMEIATSPVGPSLFSTGTPSSHATVPGKGTDPNNTSNADAASSTAAQENAENSSIATIKAKLDKFASDNSIASKLISTSEERGLVVSIQETLLFTSGSADLSPYARDIIERISTVLVGTTNQIKVEGHTDNLPIHTSQYPSNWELSVIRATNVVQLLQTDGIASSQLSAAGYGEYRPIATNDTEAGRGKNRRIDIVIIRSKYSVTEPTAVSPST